MASRIIRSRRSSSGVTGSTWLKSSGFPTYGQLIDAFCAGQLDAILVDGLSGYEFLQSERGQPFAILDDPLPPDEDLAYAHIGVRKNNSELIEAINEAIVHIKLNGEYDRIVRKYFPFSIY